MLLGVISRQLRHQMVTFLHLDSQTLTYRFSEPLFFPHHAQVDRLWYQWQNADPANRMFQYEGKTVIGSSPPTRAVTADVMHVLGLAPDAPVQDVMNTQGGLLCYRYDN
jgi:tyrosinase